MRFPGWLLLISAVVGAASNIEWTAGKMRSLAEILRNPTPAHTLWLAGIGLTLLYGDRYWPDIRRRLPRWLIGRPSAEERLDILHAATVAAIRKINERLDRLERRL
jgi:hypothetical protein